MSKKRVNFLVQTVFVARFNNIKHVKDTTSGEWPSILKLNEPESLVLTQS